MMKKYLGESKSEKQAYPYREIDIEREYLYLL